MTELFLHGMDIEGCSDCQGRKSAPEGSIPACKKDGIMETALLITAGAEDVHDTVSWYEGFERYAGPHMGWRSLGWAGGILSSTKLDEARALGART